MAVGQPVEKPYDLLCCARDYVCFRVKEHGNTASPEECPRMQHGLFP